MAYGILQADLRPSSFVLLRATYKIMRVSNQKRLNVISELLNDS